MFRIFGPPGTGKTTTLLNMVDTALSSGMHPHRIAFLAFTRKAANEAKERACARFGLDAKKDLIHFRTIHSLALSLTSIRPEQVMKEENYEELSKKIGIQIGYSARDTDDDLPSSLTKKDPFLGLIHLARLRKVDLRQQYNESHAELPWSTVSYVARSLEAYKKVYGMYDFTDMLEVFLKEADQCCPAFELTFLDEAQDLSPLQWDVADVLNEKSKKMYVAGDDDQAIYRWAGADVDHFIGLPGGSETLEQSYRVPQEVHALAEKVVKRINRRFPKRYFPTQRRGRVGRITSVAELDMSEGSWLVLAQAGYQLEPVAVELRSSGILFNYRGARSVSEKVSHAINGWEQLRKGRQIEARVARIIYGYISSKSGIRRGFKKLPGLEDDDLVTMESLIADHGLLVSPDLIWSDAMDKLPKIDIAYITALLRRGEKFNGEPRVTVSTIHGAKGGEADNVVLFTSLSPAADADMQRNPDDMHRVFYVGVTRTRENLYIVEPEETARSYSL